MALFPPGKGGGEDIEKGYKGKGITIHALTDSQGMIISALTTPANGDERAQVEPLFDTLTVKTGKPGRPKKRVGTLAADKGYDSNELRQALRKRGIQPQLPKKRRKGGKRRVGRPIEQKVPRFQCERAFAWLQRKFRRLVVRWERRTVYFDGFLSLAISYMWLQKLLSAGSGISG